MEKGNTFNYKWTLKDANFTKDRGKVFSCFACGGGSTMGYKLAGFDVIGCNEIGPRMNNIYVANHNHKINLLMDIRQMVSKAKEKDLPKELYQLDILDGSPPCSSFSIAGERQKGWGKEKKFREGQTSQILDTLFFDFIELAKYLQPKVVVAENVKGMLIGEAKQYVFKIYNEFDKAGYYCQHFLLNGSKMGLPQRRERVFFVCLRKDISEKFLYSKDFFTQIPYIEMDFNEKEIPFKEIADYKGRDMQKKLKEMYPNRKPDDKGFDDIALRMFGKASFFNEVFVKENEVVPTIRAKAELPLFSKPILMSNTEIIKASSFPLDYNFGKEKVCYVCGMSVPSIMMAHVANNIYQQWLSKL